jgi:hypothetical protein
MEWNGAMVNNHTTIKQQLTKEYSWSDMECNGHQWQERQQSTAEGWTIPSSIAVNGVSLMVELNFERFLASTVFSVD